MTVAFGYTVVYMFTVLGFLSFNSECSPWSARAVPLWGWRGARRPDVPHAPFMLQ